MSNTETACPDGGTCHHGCDGARCVRVIGSGPLTGVYPGDVWPDDVKRRYGQSSSVDESGRVDIKSGDFIRHSTADPDWWEQVIGFGPDGRMITVEKNNSTRRYSDPTDDWVLIDPPTDKEMRDPKEFSGEDRRTPVKTRDAATDPRSIDVKLVINQINSEFRKRAPRWTLKPSWPHITVKALADEIDRLHREVEHEAMNGRVAWAAAKAGQQTGRSVGEVITSGMAGSDSEIEAGLRAQRNRLVFALQCFASNTGDPSEDIARYLTAMGRQVKPDHSLLDEQFGIGQ